MTDDDAPPSRRRLRRPGWRFWAIAAGAVAGALVPAYIAFGVAATVTVRGLFFDSLGMGDAYATRWHATAWLIISGLALAAALSAPMWFLRRVAVSPPGPPPEPLRSFTQYDRYGDYERAVRIAALAERRQRRSFVPLGIGVTTGVLAITLASILPFGIAGVRDRLLAATNAVPFGSEDPVFGRDLSFFVFTVPAWQGILEVLMIGAAIALVVTVATGGVAAFAASDRGDDAALAALVRRTTSLGFALGGVVLAVGAGMLWMSRYTMVSGGDEVVAGAGKAGVGIDLPIRTVGALVIWLLAAGMVAMAVPAIRRRAEALSASQMLYGLAALWAIAAVAMIIAAGPWCIVLMAGVGILVGAARISGRQADERTQATPAWVFACAAVSTACAMAVFGPIGAALNDGIVLRGTKLQVERPYIEHTLSATRAAAGLDAAKVVDARYRQNGVSREAIAAAPASVGSLRFLDYPPTQEACARLQTFNQFYTCDDVDLDRYEIAGKPRSLFVAGREIDYGKLPDFQRRHFTFTHGYGLVGAPVNEIDAAGRPRFVFGGVPQTGVILERPEIYFGAAADMPWAMVDTTQPQFDGLTTRKVDWEGDTGIRVGSGWRRLALAKQLGGLPYIGGGRQFWNATKGAPAGPDSQVLLHRDIRGRVGELAPFLRRDADPYFAAAGGRLYVMLNTYVASDALPYAASYDGVRYLRQAAVAVMDAYSGETRLYLVDPAEPMSATWAKTYPSLFTPMAKMPQDLRAHVRVGEDLVGYQSRVAERFHTADVDRFYNNDEGWAPTQEAYGPGVNGSPVVSPVRYTYAVLPGESTERFLAIRTYKPRTPGRGIGFSGWLAVDNSPESFGRVTVIRFAANTDSPLDSLDTFTANVARNDALSAQLGVRRDQVLRGNTIVVPVGEGLLYTQPLYLDTPGDSSLPTLWQVVVSFGDGRVFAAPSFAEALEAALTGAAPAGPDGGGAAPASDDIRELVRQAGAEYDAYRKAFGASDDVAAARHLAAFQAALAKARGVADAGAGAKAP